MKLIAKREGVERLPRSKMASAFLAGGDGECMHTEGRTNRWRKPPTEARHSAKQTTMIRDRYEHDGRKHRQVDRHRKVINQRNIL